MSASPRAELLGDPSAQVWTNTPLTLDLSKIVVERFPIPVPDPGGPVFRVRVDIGEQGIALPAQKAVEIR